MNVDVTGILITVFSAVVLGVGANLLTPWVQRLVAATSLTMARRAIKSEMAKTDRYERYMRSPTEFIAHVVRNGILQGVLLAALIMLMVIDAQARTERLLIPTGTTSSSNTFTTVVLAAIIILTTVRLSSFADTLSDLANFEKYKQKRDARIRKLKEKYPELDAPDPSPDATQETPQPNARQT